jgi:PIN domain nuclease of toxin-antitoxin system
MKLLLDTHILLWAAGQPEKLSESTRALLTDPKNSLFFSAASFGEILIKQGLGREDFKVDASRLREMLIVHGYTELTITVEHVLKIESLPSLHKDPFDRLQILAIYG